MTTPLANLQTLRAQIIQQLADMTESPKLDYGADGVSVPWGQHFNNLMGALENVDKAIQRAQSPFWKISKAKA